MGCQIKFDSTSYFSYTFRKHNFPKKNNWTLMRLSRNQFLKIHCLPLTLYLYWFNSSNVSHQMFRKYCFLFIICILFVQEPLTAVGPAFKPSRTNSSWPKLAPSLTQTVKPLMLRMNREGEFKKT